MQREGLQWLVACGVVLDGHLGGSTVDRFVAGLPAWRALPVEAWELVYAVRALLSEGSAADVTGPIEELSQRMREAVAESRVERVRGTIVPVRRTAS
jgi:hypothetical protein